MQFDTHTFNHKRVIYKKSQNDITKKKKEMEYPTICSKWRELDDIMLGEKSDTERQFLHIFP